MYSKKSADMETQPMRVSMRWLQVVHGVWYHIALYVVL